MPVSSACAQDFTHVPVDFVSGDEDDSGRHSRSSLMSPKTQKAPAFLPGWCWVSSLSLLFTNTVHIINGRVLTQCTFNNMYMVGCFVHLMLYLLFVLAYVSYSDIHVYAFLQL